MNYQINDAAKTLSITVPGDVLSTNADALREKIFGLLESPAVRLGAWDTLSLDLSAAKMVDSVGLNLLVALVRAVKSRQAKIRAIIKSPNIHRTLLFTRLDREMELVTT